jgi:hypothetical protein
MRHGTLELTTQTYTALKLLEFVEVLKALPDSPLDHEPRTEREQAAETDAPPLVPEADNQCTSCADTDEHAGKLDPTRKRATSASDESSERSGKAAPEARARWKLELLADRAVALGIVDACSLATPQWVLKKNEPKPWRNKMWCIPPEQNAEFACAMENVLEAYTRSYDAKRPVVGLDEKSKQLVGEICKPITPRRGEVERCDYEFVGKGTAKLFVMVELLRGWRRVHVTARRAKTDFAEQVPEPVDGRFIRVWSPRNRSPTVLRGIRMCLRPAPSCASVFRLPTSPDGER